MAIEPKSPRIIPDEIYTAIGKVATNWATLETLMDSVLWRIASVDDSVGACFTAQFSGIGPRFRVLEALLDIRLSGHNLGPRIKELSRQAQKQNDLRNRTIHDPLSFHVETNEPTRLQISAHPKLVFRQIPISVEKINEVVDGIVHLINDFDSFVRNDIAPVIAPLPSPGKASN